MPSIYVGVTMPATVLAAALMLMGASCGGGSESSGGGSAQSGSDQSGGSGATKQPPRESGPRVERIEAVDVSELTTGERRVWVDLINDVLSPCGDPISVGRCATTEGSACRRCVPAARYLVRLIAEGYERGEIEDLYGLRYGRDSALEVTTDGHPSRGAPMAQVTIVEFSDFECPFCGRAHPILQEILREYEGQVRVVFRHYPLAQHTHAQPAARAAIAAGNQGRYWEMHDLLFEHQMQLSDEDIDRYATQLGLDMERFHADLRSPETQTRIDRDREEGQHLSVDSTPSFFVNGRRFREPPSSLAAYIREELDQ